MLLPIWETDLLLHVVDRSQENYREQIRAVEDVLAGLDFAQLPTMLVFNKIDLLGPDFPRRQDESEAVAVSALRGEGLEELQQEMDRRLGPGRGTLPAGGGTDGAQCIR